MGNISFSFSPNFFFISVILAPIEQMCEFETPKKKQYNQIIQIGNQFQNEMIDSKQPLSG